MVIGFTEEIILYGLGAFFLIFFLFAFIPYMFEVSEGIRYYKMEIKRSLNEDVRNFWRKKLKKFILKQIPIVKWFVKL